MSIIFPVEDFLDNRYILELQIYSLLVSLTLLACDFIGTLFEEIDLLRGIPMSFAKIAYCLSRWGAFGFLIGSLAFETNRNINNCNVSETIPTIFYFLSIVGSSLLFLLRLQAVYYNKRFIVYCFAILWVIVTTLAFTVPIFVTSQRAILEGAHSVLCLDKINNESVVVAAVFAPAIYDTMIFLALSWRLAKHSFVDMKSAHGLEAFFRGKYLPDFTRKMLHDGQQYYLAIILVHVPVLYLYLSGYLILKSLLFMPNFVVPSILACRIYRETRHRLNEPEDGKQLSRLMFFHFTALTEVE